MKKPFIWSSSFDSIEDLNKELYAQINIHACIHESTYSLHAAYYNFYFCLQLKTT